MEGQEQKGGDAAQGAADAAQGTADAAKAGEGEELREEEVTEADRLDDREQDRLSD